MDTQSELSVWIVRTKRIAFAAILGATIYLNITGFTTIHKPALDHTPYIWTGGQFTYVGDTPGNLIGWPVHFAFYSTITLRPGHDTLLGADVSIQSIRPLPLVVNLIALSFLIYVCWHQLWLNQTNRATGAILPFVLFFCVSLFANLTYHVVDARDSDRIGAKIEFSGEDFDSSLPEFNDYAFVDFVTFRFAQNHTINQLSVVLFWGFRSLCWAIIGCWILAIFRGAGIGTVTTIILGLVLSVRLSLDYFF